MIWKLPLWTAISTVLYLVAPSLGGNPDHSQSNMADYLDEKNARYMLPRILSLSKRMNSKLDKALFDDRDLVTLLGIPKLSAVPSSHRTGKYEKRKFPEVDSRGFESDIFDEGFGDWSPMKR